MQPKGRMPPMIMPGMGLVKKDCSGICLGIWFVRTGCSITWIEHQHMNIWFYKTSPLLFIWMSWILHVIYIRATYRRFIKTGWRELIAKQLHLLIQHRGKRNTEMIFCSHITHALPVTSSYSWLLVCFIEVKYFFEHIQTSVYDMLLSSTCAHSDVS